MPEPTFKPGLKRNRAAEAALQAMLTAIENARDAGRDYFKTAPDLMMVEVARYASRQYERNDHQIAFLQGYSEARFRHDEYQRGE